MRHGKSFNHLGRKKGHREAMLKNMATSLIVHKRIFTTTAKAKALRVYVEPLITKSKDNTSHNRRVVFGYLQDKDAVTELFTNVASKVADRPGGYTRILKTHNRLGDNADMCMMELVDFNDMMLEAKAKSGKAAGKKRTRRGKKKAADTTAAAAPVAEVKEEVKEVAAQAVEEAPVVEETPVVEEAPVAEAAAPEAPAEADDLTKIEGVGPKIAEVLTAAGLPTFAAVAGSSAEAIREILDNAEGNFKAHDPGTWCEQAQMAADGKWDELKKWQDELDGGKPA